MKHKKSCAEAFARYEERLAAWNEKHPNHCRTCGGWGGHEYYENQSPLGSGQVWLMRNWDTCPDCLDKGRCPICGALFPKDEEEYAVCPADPRCGWNWVGKGLEIPGEPPECYCYEEGLEELKGVY
jgi:hypothetical protein